MPPILEFPGRPLAALLVAILSCNPSLSAQAAPATVPPATQVANSNENLAKNPTFSGSGTPDAWKPYPPADGTDLKIETQPSGGVRMTVVNKGAGLGLGQWVDVTPGNKYDITLNTEGSGGLMLTADFLPKIPTKDSQIGTMKLSEQRVWVSADKKETKLSAVAPAGSAFMWVWLYSPKGNPSCDVLLRSVNVTGAPADAASIAAANSAAKNPATVTGPGGGNGNNGAAAAKQPALVVKDQPNGVLHTMDFETGDLKQSLFLEGGKKEVVTAPEPVRTGKYAMKVMLTHDQHRSEADSLRSEPRGEYKYGWSIYVPKDFDSTSWFSIVTQWHTYGSGKIYNMPQPGPPTCLTISKDNWELKLLYQDGESDNAAAKFFPLGPIGPDRGKWTDFVMEVNWQSPKSGGGYLRLFKNGKQVIDYQGPTWFEGTTSGPFFKVGIYKGGGSWKGEESGAILYFDEVRAGKGIPRDQVDPAKPH